MSIHAIIGSDWEYLIEITYYSLDVPGGSVGRWGLPAGRVVQGLAQDRYSPNYSSQVLPRPRPGRDPAALVGISSAHSSTLPCDFCSMWGVTPLRGARAGPPCVRSSVCYSISMTL